MLEAFVETAISEPTNMEDARLNKVYGARGSHIANTLLTDSEYLHYFLIWIVVFAAVIFSLHKIMKSTMTTKQSNQARKELERAFSMPSATEDID